MEINDEPQWMERRKRDAQKGTEKKRLTVHRWTGVKVKSQGVRYGLKVAERY